MNTRYKNIFLVSYFICFAFPGFSFTGKIDSLKSRLQINLHDTDRVNTLNFLAWELKENNLDSAILFSSQALELAKKLSASYPITSNKNNPSADKLVRTAQRGIASSHNNLGFFIFFKGNYQQSLSHHFSALLIRKKINDRIGIAASLGNIGIVYRNQGDYTNALKHFFSAVIIAKEMGNKRGVATGLYNIGHIYVEQKDYTNALKNYLEALEINKELGLKREMAMQLSSIGAVEGELKDFPNSLKHYLEALAIYKKLKIMPGIANILGNIGVIYQYKSDYQNALKHYHEALGINKVIKNKTWITANYANMGSCYTETGKYSLAEKYLDSAYTICKNIGEMNYNMDIEKYFSDLYNVTARYKLAYEHYKKYSVAKDSLFNEEKSKDIGRLEQKHEFEIAEVQRKQKEEERKRQEAVAVGRRNILQYSGILLLLFLLFIGIFLFARKFKKIHEPKTIRIYAKTLEISLFISFLIFFEFILVLLDPYTDTITGGEPAYKLLLNVILAGAIFPLHNFLEKKLKGNIIYQSETGL